MFTFSNSVSLITHFSDRTRSAGKFWSTTLWQCSRRNKTRTSSSWPHAGSCVTENGPAVLRLSWQVDTIWHVVIKNKAWNGTEITQQLWWESLLVVDFKKLIYYYKCPRIVTCNHSSPLLRDHVSFNSLTRRIDFTITRGVLLRSSCTVSPNTSIVTLTVAFVKKNPSEQWHVFLAKWPNSKVFCSLPCV